MIYLSGHVRPDFAHPAVGVILTPREGTRPDLALAGRTWWAADTGCFSQGKDLKIGRYVTWLEEKVAPRRDTCLFATAPDVLCDHEATWRRSAPVLPLIRVLGYKAAFVAQNGIDARRLAWDAFDVLFLGGDTAWKLSQSARELVEEAKQRNRWVIWAGSTASTDCSGQRCRAVTVRTARI